MELKQIVRQFILSCEILRRISSFQEIWNSRQKNYSSELVISELWYMNNGSDQTNKVQSFK